MARMARERCKSCIYHIVLRGNNRQDIFLDDDDFLRFLYTLEKKKSKNQFVIHGYCLMSNHVHLLIREKDDGISRIMSRIGTSYAWWYNRKYDRSGHVFQGRFGSECVEDDTHLLTVVRYIHNNPVRAAMVSVPEEYRWSSIRAYYGGGEHPAGLTEIEFVLAIIHKNRAEAVKRFREFMKLDNEDKCLDDQIKLRKTDGEVKAEIEAMLSGEPIGKMLGLGKKKRQEILKKIKKSKGMTQRQIARITGLSPNIIYKA